MSILGSGKIFFWTILEKREKLSQNGYINIMFLA